jgi:hypothetical protein
LEDIHVKKKIQLFIPDELLNKNALDLLMEILMKKEALRRRLSSHYFGQYVKTDAEAQRIYQQVITITHEVLGLEKDRFSTPHLHLTNHLSKLPRQIALLYAILLPICIVSFYPVTGDQGPDSAFWIVFGGSVTLMVIPLLIYRRTRLNIEHDCRYERRGQGEASISIDQLQSFQFGSYLAHEYAHHLYYHYMDDTNEAWVKEGWARMLQWEVAKRMYEADGDTGHLTHALIQIISELKVASQMISMVIHGKIPRRLRSVRSLFHRNPLFRLLTGTPGFSPPDLMNHAVGTAIFFIRKDRDGLEDSLGCFSGRFQKEKRLK